MKKYLIHLGTWSLIVMIPYITTDRGGYIHDFYINNEWLIIVLALALASFTANFIIGNTSSDVMAETLTKTQIEEMVQAQLLKEYKSKEKIDEALLIKWENEELEHQRIDEEKLKIEEMKIKEEVLKQKELEEDIRFELEKEEGDIIYERAKARVDAKVARNREILKAKIRKQMEIDTMLEIEKAMS